MGSASTWARPAVEAVLNGLWQGVLLVLVVALGMRLARRSNAATRYVLWWICLLAVVALPGAGWAWRRALEAGWSMSALGRAATTGPALLLPAGPWPELLLAVWAATAGILLLRVARGYRSMQALKGRSEPLSATQEALFRDLLPRERRPIRIRRSPELPSPITAGLADPMILMPSDLLARLRAEDLRQIVLHELTHVRRGDDRAVLLQRVLEALFFFHPAVRWLAARLDLEREVACDDRVVELTGERKAYARCLTRLAELGPVRHSALASGALLHRGHLVRRVTLLLDARRRVGERVSAALAGGALMLLGGAVVWLSGLAPVVGVPEPASPAMAEAVEAQPTPLTPAEALAAAPLPAPPPPRLTERVEIAPPQPTAAPAFARPAVAATPQAVAASALAAEDRASAPAERAAEPARAVTRAVEAAAVAEEEDEEELLGAPVSPAAELAAPARPALDEDVEPEARPSSPADPIRRPLQGGPAGSLPPSPQPGPAAPADEAGHPSPGVLPRPLPAEQPIRN